jgi:hypothetical protein
MVAFNVNQWSHRPIIDNQNVDAGNPAQDFRKTAIHTSEGEIAQTRCAGIESGKPSRTAL